jgi:hypothetical protein
VVKAETVVDKPATAQLIFKVGDEEVACFRRPKFRAGRKKSDAGGWLT